MTLQAIPDGSPRWASAPGDTIRTVMDARGLTAEHLADELQISDPDARRLIRGEVEVTAGIAQGLARVLGSTESFWLRREAQYRRSLGWLAADELARRTPLAEMATKGWLIADGDWQEQALALLRYFGVRDADEWTTTWTARLSGAHYRTSETFQSDELAIAAWLRRAEIQASGQSLDDWSAQRLRQLIPSLRSLSRIANPQAFLPRVKDLLSTAGVALVVVPATRENRLSGAAFRLPNGARAIALSGRHLAEDHLWFTLFHEIGHLLLHGDEGEFLDSLDSEEESLASIEIEANAFARESLLPWGVEDLGSSRASGPTYRQVVSFATRNGVAPGIVVGRLHYDGVSRFNQLNGLIRRYKWHDDQLILRT